VIKISGISRVSLDILNIFDRNEGCPFDIAPSMSINQVGQISTASCLPQAARYFRIGKTPLSFMLEKLIKCETDVFGYLTQQDWRDVTALMKWNRCAAACRITKLFM